MNDKTAYILARLETGFRTDADRLKELEKNLAASLQRARQLGEGQGTHEEWDKISQSTKRIEESMNQINHVFTTKDDDRVARGLNSWQAIENEDDEIEEALSAIRAQTTGLSLDAQEEQDALHGEIDASLDKIRGVSQAMRVKLELLKEYSDEDAELAVKDILSKLPNLESGSLEDAEAYLSEYRKAGEELKREKHKYKGLGDIFKGIFMWVESPEERVEKNRADSVEKI